MKISLIIPAFNEEKLIGENLRRLRSAAERFLARGWECEWIVCDNNSTDRTADLARAEGARVIFEPVNQIAKARNTGARAATGDWLVFVDADTQPDPGLMEEVARQIESGRCLAGGSTLRMENATGSARWFVELWNWVSRRKKWMAGSFIFCEAIAFARLGGFNEELFASEEIELSQRLHGLARECEREVVIIEGHPLTTSGRKVELYSPLEHLGFMLRTVLSNGRNLRHRRSCTLWYDGRR